MTDPSDPHRDLSGVLHDVSNALTVLLGWVGEALAPGAPPEAVTYALTIIEQRARLARDLARHAIGSPIFDEQRSLESVVDEVLAALRVEAQRVGVVLRREGDPGSARVSSALDLSQVLTNLVMNAIAHTPPTGVVRVEVVPLDEACVLVVSDEGPGVEVERRERIFRGDSMRPGGVGIGLRHSRALAQAAGGDLTLDESERPADSSEGRGPNSRSGARFIVTWPRADIVVPRPPVSAPRVASMDGLRVLLVEDDAAVTQLLETALEARGADVTTAGSSPEFTAALAEGPYDAALVDLSPIADDPAGALARLRTLCPAVKVVLITGSVDGLPEMIPASSVELVRKPFEVREVIATLSKK